MTNHTNETFANMVLTAAHASGHGAGLPPPRPTGRARRTLLAQRVGATVEELFTGKSVYFQPGDDTASLRDTVAALEEVDCEKRAMIFDMAMSNYF